MNKHILLDGDVMVYRAAWSEQEGTEDEAIQKIDELLTAIWEAVDPYGTRLNRTVFLTGKGNFRTDIAKTAVYKGNRTNTEKPKYFSLIRSHLITKWDAVISEGEEADDLIGIYANNFGYDRVVIVSTDKDYLQIPTTIYNPMHQTWTTVSKWEALVNFYTQILTGDTVDNIKGIRGIGPVKAKAILYGCDSEVALYWACVEAYRNSGMSLELAQERVLENGKLLYLRRKVGEIWEAPV
jgi:hypothetical protein